MLNPSAIAGSWQSKKTYFQCIIDRKIIHFSLKPKTSQNCGRTSFSVKLLDFPRSMKVHNTIWRDGEILLIPCSPPLAEQHDQMQSFVHRKEGASNDFLPTSSAVWRGRAKHSRWDFDSAAQRVRKSLFKEWKLTPQGKFLSLTEECNAIAENEHRSCCNRHQLLANFLSFTFSSFWL